MSSNEQTKSSNTKMIVAFAVVIAVAAGVAIKYQVPSDGAAGTVMPAERHRGEQISSDNVTLSDETVAQVMQTDVYQLIITDAAIRRSHAQRYISRTVVERRVPRRHEKRHFSRRAEERSLHEYFKSRLLPERLEERCLRKCPAHGRVCKCPASRCFCERTT